MLTTDADRLTVTTTTDGSATHVRHLLDEVDPHGTHVARFAVHTATLDDVFLALTGHAAIAAETAEEKETASV